MKLAVVGSRSIKCFDLSPYISDNVDTIISGGANGIDTLAEEYADRVVLTSDNPRSEDPQQIISDILAGFKSTSNVLVEPDRGDAIKAVKNIAKNDDVVVLAGKGHETYQILKDTTVHFDDREEAKKIFAMNEVTNA